MADLRNRGEAKFDIEKTVAIGQLSKPRLVSRFAPWTWAQCEGTATFPQSQTLGERFGIWIRGFATLEEGKRVEDVDIYRETPVRLLGYANEVGEAFRPIVSVWFVRASYVAASGYVLADTLDKAKKASQHKWENQEIRRKEMTKTVLDTLIWQSFASVIIPGATINRTCYYTLMLLNKTAKVPQYVRNWTTVGICLSVIPLIVHPIDSFVHFVMDHSLRKYWGDKPS